VSSEDAGRDGVTHPGDWRGAQFDFSDWSTIPLYNKFGIDGGVPTDEMLY
jgi:hypothetical protein